LIISHEHVARLTAAATTATYNQSVFLKLIRVMPGEEKVKVWVVQTRLLQALHYYCTMARKLGMA